jgi:hypothetical protein
MEELPERMGKFRVARSKISPETAPPEGMVDMGLCRETIPGFSTDNSKDPYILESYCIPLTYDAKLMDPRLSTSRALINEQVSIEFCNNTNTEV